jgi:poly(hydroxyalkanoate) granule-associated protein
MARTQRKNKAVSNATKTFNRLRGIVLGKAVAAKDAALAGAETAKTRTLETVTSLEKIFEQRVSRAIARLGVPTASDVRALSRQVAELQASVERLKRARARA